MHGLYGISITRRYSPHIGLFSGSRGGQYFLGLQPRPSFPSGKKKVPSGSRQWVPSGPRYQKWYLKVKGVQKLPKGQRYLKST